MAKVIFEDYSIQVKEAIDSKINAVLEECAGELESAVKRNTRVGAINGGKTKNSWKHRVIDSEHKAIIGSPLENAIWEEFGTGEHALEGNGRKGGWWYKNPHPTGEHDKFIFTYGKTPSRAFYKAYMSLKNKIIQRIQNSLKGL